MRIKNNIFIFIIVFIAFIAFTPLFKLLGQNASQEFASAIFGTVFASIITMLLLNKQTQTVEEANKSQVIFKEKLILSNKIIKKLDKLYHINKLNKLKDEDITKLEFLILRSISILSKDTMDQFIKVYNIININYKNGSINNMGEIKKEIITLSNKFRYELALNNDEITPNEINITI